MLSSRLALAVGTLSLVTVTSISTAVLVNDGAQRLVEPPVVSAPRVSPPVFRAPPLVVPETPGTVVTRRVEQRPAQQGPVAPDIVTAPDRAVVAPVPVPPPEPQPPVEAPVVVPVAEEPVLYPPLYEAPALDRPGKGKHLGALKATGRDSGRAKGPKHPKG